MNNYKKINGTIKNIVPFQDKAFYSLEEVMLSMDFKSVDRYKFEIDNLYLKDDKYFKVLEWEHFNTQVFNVKIQQVELLDK